MDKDRRNFIKQTGWTLIGGGLLMTTLPILTTSANASKAKGNLYAFIVDTEKCIGCGNCVTACNNENNVPEPFLRTWIERYTILENDEVLVDSPDGGEHGFKPVNLKTGEIEKSFFVPKLCNHCKKPNCVQVCPVGATYVTSQGFVLIDSKHCIGCSYCVQACPYGARFVNPQTKTADKCTWCYHRIIQGQEPACVLACPVGARQFGRVDTPESPVAKILKEKRIQVLKPGTGNEPMTMYVGLDKEVI